MYHYHNLNVLSTGQSMWQDHRSFVIAIYILTTSIVIKGTTASSEGTYGRALSICKDTNTSTVA